jgi:DNA-binding MarR family transcriptional regulator
MATNASPLYRFGSLLALARQSWIEQIRERMQEAGFPGYRRADARMLSLLLPRPLAIGQLGEALGISRQGARQLADGLVERGYASFGTDPADSRRTLVVLTPSGKAYGRAIWLAQDELNDMVRNRVSEADLAAADAVLRAVFPDEKARQQIDERLPPPLTREGAQVARAPVGERPRWPAEQLRDGVGPHPDGVGPDQCECLGHRVGQRLRHRTGVP